MKEKRTYEAMELSVVKFETEEVLWTSGFFGEEDDLTNSDAVRMNSESSYSVKNQVNPT